MTTAIEIRPPSWRRLALALLPLAFSCRHPAQDAKIRPRYMDGTECPCDSILHLVYSSNGGIIEHPMVDGKIRGLVKLYRGDGRLRLEEEFTEIDRKHQGDKLEYYESGELRRTTPYVDDIIQGTQREFYETGSRLSETPIVNGKRNGLQRYYSEQGTLMHERPFIDGKLNGRVRAYFESGPLKSETPYVDDLEDGVSRTFHESGRIRSETRFVKGTKIEFTEYADSTAKPVAP